MTLDELIHYLEEVKQALPNGGDTPVMANNTVTNYPFEIWMINGMDNPEGKPVVVISVE